MDGKRFDQLVRALAAGSSRRALIKRALGLSVAAAATSTGSAGARELTTRNRITTAPPPLPPTTTTPAPPPSCSGSQVLCALHGCCDGACSPGGRCCPAGRFVCGEECCSSPEQCCDRECCADGSVCIGEEQCCPIERLCAGQCCPGETPVCCEQGGTAICIDPQTQCCGDHECPDDPDTCRFGLCQPGLQICTLTDACSTAEGSLCCGEHQCAIECCDDSSCDATQFCEDGRCVPGCNEDADCVHLSSACSTGVCEDSTCIARDGCDEGSCCGGVCLDCTSLDGLCTMGVCDSLMGNCVAMPINEEQRCDSDSDLCTNFICRNGQCVDDGPAVICENPGDSCTTSVCDPSTGNTCIEGTLEDGSPCEDGGRCLDGTCCTGCLIDGHCYADGDRNPENKCERCDTSGFFGDRHQWVQATLGCVTPVCKQGGCNPETGLCEFEPDPSQQGKVCGVALENTFCQEGEATCQNGECVGTPRNEGESCGIVIDSECGRRVCRSGICTLEPLNEGEECTPAFGAAECRRYACSGGTCTAFPNPGAECQPDPPDLCNNYICRGDPENPTCQFSSNKVTCGVSGACRAEGGASGTCDPETGECIYGEMPGEGAVSCMAGVEVDPDQCCPGQCCLCIDGPTCLVFRCYNPGDPQLPPNTCTEGP